MLQESKVAKGHSLVLRCVKHGFYSRNGFKYPDHVGGVAEAPDWKPTTACGKGLHGWLLGAGSRRACNYAKQSISHWLVLEVKTRSIVDLKDKVKFPRGKVVFIGDEQGAIDFILRNDPKAKRVAIPHAMIHVPATRRSRVLLGQQASAMAMGRANIEAEYGAAVVACGKLTLKPHWPSQAEGIRAIAGEHSDVTVGSCSRVIIGIGSQVVARSSLRLISDQCSVKADHSLSAVVQSGSIEAGAFARIIGDNPRAKVGGTSRMIIESGHVLAGDHAQVIGTGGCLEVDVGANSVAIVTAGAYVRGGPATTFVARPYISAQTRTATVVTTGVDILADTWYAVCCEPNGGRLVFKLAEEGYVPSPI